MVLWREKKILTFLISILIFISVFAQHRNIMVSLPLNDREPQEPSIAVSPKNTNNMVIGTNSNHYFYSNDGGETWSHGLLNSTYGVMCDPCIVADMDGDFFYFHLSKMPSYPRADRIVCQKSDYTGDVWSDGSYMGYNGKMQDKEWAVVDLKNNNIYATWTQFDEYASADTNHFTNIRFSKSTNGGVTWSNAVIINEVSGDCLDEDNTVEGAVPAVGPDGQIYVSWGGPAGLVFDKSIDGGETWLENDIFVSELPGGWDFYVPGVMRCNGMPVTECDASGGQYTGNIYINWSDQRNGIDDTDIWFTKSTDCGETWSPPKRVNDDPPGKHQFFSWMDVDQVTGNIYIVFYDRRNYEDNQTDVYLAVSTDGGETFVNHKISESPCIPDESVFFGDYICISAHDNVIRPVWIRMDNLKLSLWTAIIDTDVLLAETGIRDTEIPIEFDLKSIYPNPFNSSALIEFKLPEKGHLLIKVFNILGNEISTLYNGFKEAGTFTVKWTPGKEASGIYLIQAKYGDSIVTRKAVYIK